MTLVYLALGSNQGDPLANLRLAVQKLEQSSLEVATKSRIYRTQSVESGGEGDFLNAVIFAETWLSAHELLRNIHQIEAEMGRAAPSTLGAHRSGARAIDIDILHFGDETFATPELEIPHPRALLRPFVLRPLLDILKVGWTAATDLEL